MIPYSLLQNRLNRRGMFRIRPGLECIRKVLQCLGNPQDGFESIHIAGTNGKGSVAASFESVLRQSGLRTGLYTSPHLQDIRERIQIDRSPIGVARFCDAAESVFSAERQAGLLLTYFEFLTAIAFLTFSSEHVKAAIIETGMGGRWDATNVLKNPALAVITSVGLDHTSWLGRNEQLIAREKADIIKEGCPVVSGARGLSANIIISTARHRSAPLWQIDREFCACQGSTRWMENSQSINYWGPSHSHRHIHFGLLGTYQIDNAALTLAGLEVLIQNGWEIPEQAISSGLSEVSWPGRFQLVNIPGTPLIILDGAHNVPAMRRLCESLEQSPWQRTYTTYVYGVYRDKDYSRMLQVIAPYASRMIFCTLHGSRALPAKKALMAWKGQPPIGGLAVIGDPHKALTKAVQGTPKNGLVIATGSLNLIGLLLGDLKPGLQPTPEGLEISEAFAAAPLGVACV